MTAPLVFIDGDQGTTGLQIHERLRDRNDLRLLTLPEADRKNAARRAEAINACDIAVLCLPDGPARDAVASIANPAVRVIDASSAHRTEADWVYGFAEMSAAQSARIASARRVTNPGCYPTGAIALLRPLVDAGLVPADYPLAIHAVSGYSGGGRARVDEHEGPSASGAPAFQVYGLGLAHKHTPEIEKHAGLAQRPFFLPAYGSYRQGIVLTMFDSRNNLAQQVVSDVRTHLGDKVYHTLIPRNVRVSEAPSYGKPAILYDLKCAGSQAYLQLASEVIQRERQRKAA